MGYFETVALKHCEVNDNVYDIRGGKVMWMAHRKGNASSGQPILN